MISRWLLLLIPLPTFQFSLAISDGDGTYSEENRTDSVSNSDASEKQPLEPPTHSTLGFSSLHLIFHPRQHVL